MSSVKCTLSFFCCLPCMSFQVSGTLQPRWAHSITAFCLVDGVTEVTMFGGSADPWTGSNEKQSKLADTTSLQFCKCMSMFLRDRVYVCVILLSSNNWSCLSFSL